MSIDISYNNSINCFNLLYYIITTTSFTVSFTLVNVFQYIYIIYNNICRLSLHNHDDELLGWIIKRLKSTILYTHILAYTSKNVYT